MESLKTKMIVLAAALLLGIAGPAAAYGEQSGLNQVVYITLTKACGCTLAVCQAGDIVVIHEDKCTGCKTCEVSCPTGAIRIARILEGYQQPVQEGLQ